MRSIVSGLSLQEVSLNSKHWIRQSHRWLSIAFTVAVFANIVALGQTEAVRMAVAFLPLLPLAFLLFSGLYLFVLPYVAKWRNGQGTNERV